MYRSTVIIFGRTHFKTLRCREKHHVFYNSIYNTNDLVIYIRILNLFLANSIDRVYACATFSLLVSCFANLRHEREAVHVVRVFAVAYETRFRQKDENATMKHRLACFTTTSYHMCLMYTNNTYCSVLCRLCQ